MAKSKVIHSGIDIERFVTRERNVDLAAHYGIDSTRHSVFGIVARLAEEKGHVYLVQAFALVHREMRNARLMIIGDAPLHPKDSRRRAMPCIGPGGAKPG